MTGTHSAKSSDSPPPNPAKFTRYAAHLTGRKRARETIRVFGARLSGTVVSVSRGSKADAAKARYSRRNFEPHKQIINCNINNLVAGCAGSPDANSSPERIPCSPGRNREFQQKSGFLADGRRENAR